MAMAIRTIDYTVGKGGISPATLQDGGLQGEHKVTLLRFKLDDELWEELQNGKEDGTLIYHINGVDGLRVAHPSDVTVLEGQTVEYYLERCLTKYGGKVEVQLVIELCKDGKSARELHTYTAQLQLTASPNSCGNHEEDATISAMAYGAKVSADSAKAAAEDAKKFLGDTQEAAKVFEGGTEVIFQGGNASSSFKTEIKVDNSVIQNSNNPVSGGAVYAELKAVKGNISENKDDVESAKASVEDLQTAFDTYKDGIMTVVVDCGTDDNGWSYLKYSNGFAMCWWQGKPIPESERKGESSEGGPYFVSKVIQVALPFKIFSGKIFGNSTNHNSVVNGYVNSNENYVQFVLKREIPISEEETRTDIFVVGKWKE